MIRTSTPLRRPGRRSPLRLALAALGALALAACSAGEDDDDAGTDGEGVHVVFLAEQTSIRFASADVPHFLTAVIEACPSCATGSALASDQEQQNGQASAAIADGADVLVVAPLDSAGAAALAQEAAAAGVAVVSYDSLVTGAALDAYVTFDSGVVGQIGAQTVLASDPAPGAVVIELDGDEANSNAAWVARGAAGVLEGNIEVAYQAFVPDWSGDNAYELMTEALSELGDRPLAGVVAANDGIAGGAARALRDAGWTGDLPPISGQDAEVAALRRLLSGDQAVTAYKPMKDLAGAAAEVALQLGRGEQPTATTATTDNGAGQVPTVLLEPTAVTASDLSSTVIADGFTTLDALCAGAASRLCADAGLR